MTIRIPCPKPLVGEGVNPGDFFAWPAGWSYKEEIRLSIAQWLASDSDNHGDSCMMGMGEWLKTDRRLSNRFEPGEVAQDSGLQRLLHGRAQWW